MLISALDSRLVGLMSVLLYFDSGTVRVCGADSSIAVTNPISLVGVIGCRLVGLIAVVVRFIDCRLVGLFTALFDFDSESDSESV